jgi:NAD(P)-dependent dehydrogenase (short-subunit alcohol dehydrogenase family)
MPGRVQDKVALITGAASGIGAATARLLAREGARLALADLDAARGEAVAAAIRAGGAEALFLEHDVTDEAAWERVIAATLARFGRLDVLVNNAGIGGPARPPDEQGLEDWRRVMAVNLDGVFLGTKHAIRAMKRNRPKPGGSIVNLSSILGLVGGTRSGAYTASKGGVRLYTKSAALACAREGNGVRVNSVHPGYIWTPLVEHAFAQLEDPEEMRRKTEALHPIGRLGEPEDIAYGILYLASDEAKFVTGAELVIDGGYTAQ